MNKIYLVGTLYDDFSGGGFDVVAVADTLEMAQILARAYLLNNEGIEVYQMQIREWKVNIHNPIGTVESVEYDYSGEDVPAERTVPFISIEVEERKNIEK